MLAQRLRRRPNIKQALGKRFMFAGSRGPHLGYGFRLRCYISNKDDQGVKMLHR